MKGAIRVMVGKGRVAHLRYDEHYTYCGLGEITNSSTKGLNLCQRCEILREMELTRKRKLNE